MSKLKIALIAASVFTPLTLLARTAEAQSVCPSYGYDTTCGAVITITDQGSSITYSGQGPYEGSDDTLIGVVNKSSQLIYAMGLTSSKSIFAFDGDGITIYGAPGNGKDPTGYGGPNAYYTNYSGAGTSGVVNFINPLAANGGTTYFSLEDTLQKPTAIQDIVNNSINVSLGGRFDGTAFGLLNLFRATNITGTFTPNNGLSLTQAAAQAGFTGFDFQQTITNWPNPDLHQAGTRNVMTAPPGFYDPPPGGYDYCVTSRWTACQTSYPFYPTTSTTNSVTLFDSPRDPMLQPGQTLDFKVRLIGILPGYVRGTDCLHLAVPTCVDLGVGFDWNSTYNGSYGGIAVSASNQPIDPATADGLGGVTITGIFNTTTYSPFSVTTINGVTVPVIFATATAIDTSQPYFLASDLGTSVDPIFQGGTLRMDALGKTYTYAFTIDGAGATIDTFGNASIFSGAFSNAVAGTPGSIIVQDGTGGGAAMFMGQFGSANDKMGTLTNRSVITFGPGFTGYFSNVVNAGSLVNDGTVSDTLSNTGTVSNVGTYNADVTNSGAAATITNQASGVWNGQLLSNTAHATVINNGHWLGNATNTANLVNAGRWTGTIDNAGTLTNLTGGVIDGLVTHAAGETVNAGTLNKGVLISGGLLTTTGTVNGGITVSAGAAVTAQGQVNGAVDNTGLFLASGPLSGDSSPFTNRQGAIFAVDGNAISGVGTLTNMNGATVRIGTSLVNGHLSAAAIMNNGIITAQNGRVGDTLAVGGNYASSAGSALLVDVDMGAKVADTLTAGSLSGTSIISLQNLGAHKAYFQTPIILVSSQGGTGTFTAASDATTAAALASNGVVNYRVANIAGTHDWGIVSSLNTSAISSVAASTTDLIASVTSEFLPGVHELIGGNRGGERWSGQVWAKTGHGDDSVDSKTTPSDVYSPISKDKLSINFDGVQIGGGGRVALEGSTLHFGATAGYVNGNARDDLIDHTNLKMPFYGIYGVIVLRHALVDVEAYHNELSLRPAAILGSTTVKGASDILSLSAAFPVTVRALRVEPFLRYTHVRTTLKNLALSQGVGELGFSSLDGDSEVAGVLLNAMPVAGRAVSPPFLSVSIEQNQGATVKTTFLPTGGASPVDFMTQRTTRFIHIGAGGSALFAQGTGKAYLRADWRFGSRLNGVSLTAGLLKAF